ncbi:phage tail assembly protein [Loktanella sp. TSTF-M6]|uniref:Phage tail assembly protein n=1 Tax=Loktanella gaetbuli TaxID=2881335 RepID=A0ABS8BS94_9RHOB|nr:phage tail assembly protein [Loktanella gaetbuli]MCB5198605.1 phage tail assembly protein [Loktanella gaetbuli]
MAKLTTPIKREGGDVKSVEIRQPTAGELRGCKLTQLLQMDTSELLKVLPRVTVPALLPAEVEALAPADLLTLGMEVVGFLASPALKEEALRAAEA